MYPEFFSENPDSKNPEYQTQCGIYKPNCGLSELVMRCAPRLASPRLANPNAPAHSLSSWGHDEYMYQVCVGNKCTLPQEALVRHVACMLCSAKRLTRALST